MFTVQSETNYFIVLFDGKRVCFANTQKQAERAIAEAKKLQVRKEKEFRKNILTKEVKSFERHSDGYVEIKYNSGCVFYCRGPLVENAGL